jgi:glycyl-tRNA synthetase beta chain
MPDLLLELLSEEIPARMQTRAAADLARLVTEGLAAAGLETGETLAFATPRRLALCVRDVPAMSPAVTEERKGPRVGAPEKAIEGFLRGAGLSSIEEAEIVADPKKGEFYVARMERPGRPAPEIIAEVVPAVCAKFPWPKSMRWGDGDFTWVRPLHNVLCLYDGGVVPFEIAGFETNDRTRGHRFHGREWFTVTDFEDYGHKLVDAKVLLPTSERAAAIREQAEDIAAEAGLQLIEDEALFNENAGLTEWPTVLMGTFDEDFLDVPPECLITSMKVHQKCFSLRDPATGKLANRFLCVTNLIAADRGEQVIAGNEKVIRARLADAKFFWEQDLEHPLDEMALKLKDITFHAKLGSQRDRVERIAELAYLIAGSVDADPDSARRAAQLCKADLVSEVVGEFPELQGLMGRYYAEKGGIKPEIARAIELHYKPKGPTDTVPLEEDGDGVAVAVALADKLDTLVGFWAIDEKPTGSGDPYQLRRAALGVIRICLENDLRLTLGSSIFLADALRFNQQSLSRRGNIGDKLIQLQRSAEIAIDPTDIQKFLDKAIGDVEVEAAKFHLFEHYLLRDDLLAFFADRLKVHLREEGVRHDLIDAVFALPGQDDIALIVKRVEALSHFLETDDGENLLAGAKRAANILAIEEKNDDRTYEGTPDGDLLVEPAERALEAAIAKVKFDTKAAIDVESFEGAMRALAELRAPVDKFFDEVKVNDDDPRIRENRLKLLSEIRAATFTVADVSKIAG